MEQKKLSIIVPIYNVELYLERCLRSLEAQDISIDDYEIICINDGSPDESKEVLIKLQKEFDNIILIDQENQGVSRARNNGVNIARGKFVLFIDPDDYVDANSFSRILKNANKQDAVVSFLGFTILNEDGSFKRKVFNEIYSGKVFSGLEAYFLSRSDSHADPDRMWAVLFKTEFLNQNRLRYLPDVPYLEDGEFIARILCLSDRCIFDGDSFYQRTTRPGSATNSELFHSEKATNGFLLSVCNLKRFQELQMLSQNQKEFLNQPILKFALLSISSCVEWGCFSRIKPTIKRLHEYGLKKIQINGCKRPYKCYGKTYNVSVYLIVLVLFIWPRIKRIVKLQ